MTNIIKQDLTQITFPKIIFQVTIKQMDNRAISLSGFPINLATALQLMSDATNAIIDLFIKEAKANNLDKNNTIKQSKIITLPK